MRKNVSCMLKRQIESLETLCKDLLEAKEFRLKSSIVEKNPLTQDFLKNSSRLKEAMNALDPKDEYLVKIILAIGQGPIVYRDVDDLDDIEGHLKLLVTNLAQVEKFYDFMGGIAGYYLQVLKMIDSKRNQESTCSDDAELDEPEGLDISQNNANSRRTVRWGIEHLHEMAEFYPLGGSGERLNLKDESNGESLPAAQLLFCGRTLLEGLIRDLQGREYLHHKLFGAQLHVPIVMMTSNEKDNHNRILKICEENRWFGRKKEEFDFFIQLLVPVITTEGEWAMQAPLRPFLKPGGHGVIWKLAKENGVIEKLSKKGRGKALVRQINNPVAGLDGGLFSLAGIGCEQGKDFGFASCPRRVNTPEGMDVLCEKKKQGHYEYCITNIEYTEFEHKGIQDVPIEPDSPYSRFPANTNILFVNLKALDPVLQLCPIPGLLINMKSKLECYDGPEKTVEKQVVRLESTMQNIADYIVDHYPQRLPKGQRGNLRTFLTYNDRQKTISVVKQAYQKGKTILGTPVGAFFELMQNYHDLLTKFCNMQLPPQQTESEFLSEGPSFIALFNPALGPLYSIIGQKIQNGQIAKGSKLVLEITEAHIVNLHLEGCLIIEADRIVGKSDKNGVSTFDSKEAGKCTMINVVVRNTGIDTVDPLEAWKCTDKRQQELRIILRGNAEFVAKDVVLEGNMQFEVLSGQRLVVYQQGDELAWHCESIDEATWQWNYHFDENDNIRLELLHLP